MDEPTPANHAGQEGYAAVFAMGVLGGCVVGVAFGPVILRVLGIRAYRHPDYGEFVVRVQSRNQRMIGELLWDAASISPRHRPSLVVLMLPVRSRFRCSRQRRW